MTDYLECGHGWWPDGRLLRWVDIGMVLTAWNVWRIEMNGFKL